MTDGMTSLEHKGQFPGSSPARRVLTLEPAGVVALHVTPYRRDDLVTDSDVVLADHCAALLVFTFPQ